MAGYLPAIGDLLQFRVCCYTPSQIALNIVHYKVVAVTGVGLNLDEFAVWADLAWKAGYKALMGSPSKWRGVGVQNLMPARTREYSSIAGDGVGTAGTTMAPTQTSWLIRLRGALAGRKGVGHVYPGFPGGTFLNAAGEQTAPGLAAITNVAANFGPQLIAEAGVNTSTLDMQIRNADTDIPVPKTPTSTPVYQLYPAPLWATQRRRGDFGKQNLPPF